MGRYPGTRATQFFLLAWAVVFFGSIAVYYIIPVDGPNGVSAWDRLVYLGFGQAGAAGLALICSAVSRRLPKGLTLRSLGLVPLALVAAMMAAFMVLVLWANLQSDNTQGAAWSPGPPTMPVRA